METNYRIAFDKGWKDLAHKVPEDVARCMNITYLSDKRQFIVPHLNETYIVDCSNHSVRNEKDGSVAGLLLSILILHYLAFFTEEKDIENRWVSLKEIPNGGMLFYPTFYKESITGLIQTFGNYSGLFLECTKKLGGFPTCLGTASAFFDLFPKIRLCVVIWEGDNEIPANATMLFDPSISYFLHIESIIGIGGYLSNRLIQFVHPDKHPGHEMW